MSHGLFATVFLGALVLWLRASKRDEPSLGWFCYQYDVPDTVGARHLVHRYLWRTRAWRVGGAAAGCGAAIVAASIGHGHGSAMVWLLAGWIGAGLVAELTVRRARGGRAFGALGRVGALDLLPASSLGVLACAFAATATVAFASICVRVVPLFQRVDASPPSGVRLVVVLALTAGLGALAGRGLRSLARMPYPVGVDTDVDLAEHAIRGSALVRVVAAWSAVQFTLTAVLADDLTHAMHGPWSLLAALTVGVGVAGAVVSWWWLPARANVRSGRHVLA